jgi:hypothetical protein
MEHTIGTRLRCGTCGAEAILTKAGDSKLTCCGGSLAPVATPGHARGGDET